MTKSITRTDLRQPSIRQTAEKSPAKNPISSAIRETLRFLRYGFSLIYTRSFTFLAPKRYPWWNEITGENIDKIGKIILGALPAKNQVTQLATSGVTAVISLNEGFERESSIFYDPASSDNWQRANIDNLHLSEEDFNPVSQKSIKKGIAYLEARIKTKGSTYVHCKAGRGRSATVVVCHIMKQLNLTPDKAIAYVRKSRSVISINKRQKPAIIKYHQFLNEEKTSGFTYLLSILRERCPLLFRKIV